MRSTHAWGFPCCIGLPLVCMPPPLPRQNLKECSSLSFFAIAAFPGLITGRLLRPHFGACSAFTRVAACILAGSLNDPFHRRLQPFRYLHGCSDCYRLERKLPGGICTRWKTVHWHGAHETPVDVQTHDGRGTNHQAYLWQYGTPGGATVFDFRMSRKREGPLNFLGNFEGLLQTDGYAAYDRVGGPKMVHAACWAHARRRFIDAVKLNKQDAASVRAVKLMDELFAIDARAARRRDGSRPWPCPATGESSAYARPVPQSHPGDEQDGAAQERRRPSVQLRAFGSGRGLHASSTIQNWN